MKDARVTRPKPAHQIVQCQFEGLRLLNREDLAPARLSNDRPIGSVEFRVKVMLYNQAVDLIEDAFALFVTQRVGSL